MAYGIRCDPAGRQLRATGCVALCTHAGAPSFRTPLLEFAQPPEALPDIRGGAIHAAELDPTQQRWLSDTFRARSCAGWLVTENATVVGAAWVLGAQSRFPARIADIRALRNEVASTLIDTDRQMLPSHSRPLHALLHAQGDPWMCGAGGELPSPVLRRVRSVLREMSGVRSWTGFMHNLRLRVDRVRHHEACGVAVSVDPLPRTRVSAYHRLPRAPRRVVALAARGLTLQAVATRLQRSRDTVKQHLQHAYAAFGAGSRAELTNHYLDICEGQPSEPQRTR